MNYTEKILNNLDNNLKMVPLTFDVAFKSVMLKNTNIFKKFLIETMNLKIDFNRTNIIFLDKELIKENTFEKGKTVDLNIKIDHHLLITVEMNHYQYEDVRLRNQIFLEKLHTMQYEVGDEYKVLKSKYLYQLNLNAKDNYKNKGENIIVSYDITDHSIFNDNVKTFIKHLEYYKDMFYTNSELMSFDEIFMAGLMAKNFTDLYHIMKNILSDKELNKFMESVINMSKDNFVLHEWAKEEMDKLVMDTAIERGRSEGIEQKELDMIKSMLKNNAEYDFISKVSGKPIEKIKEIEKSM